MSRKPDQRQKRSAVPLLCQRWIRNGICTAREQWHTAMPRAGSVKAMVWLVVVVALTLAGCKGKEPEGRKKPAVQADESWPNVLLISIETLRPDHLKCYGYSRDTSPRIDALAREGVRFVNAISSTSWSLPAHAAMFTGLYDSVHGCTDTDKKLDDSRYTMAERFQDYGYATVGFYSGPYFHPSFGLGQGFDKYVDCTSYATLTGKTAKAKAWGGPQEFRGVMAASHREVASEAVYGRVRTWLEANKRKPFFMFVHLWDPHFDYVPKPPYDTMFDPDYEGEITGANFFFNNAINKDLPARDIEHLKALYDGEIAYTDKHVGMILDELEARGLSKNTIVVLTSGNGTEFFEHGDKGDRATLFDEAIKIPLIIRYPERVPAGAHCNGQVRSVDILPTVAELAGFTIPKRETMGQSLVPIFNGQPLKYDALAISEFFSRGRELRSFRHLRFKMILDLKTSLASVYDLATDPGEQRWLPSREGRVQKAAEAAANLGTTWLKAYQAAMAVGDEAPEVAPEVLENLESLGLVGQQRPLGPTSAPASQP